MLSRRALLGPLLVAPCAAPFAAPVAVHAQAPLNVVATTGMIADAVRNIAGDLAQVTALMGPGVDPHSYRQTRSDIAAMTRADLVLWNGLYLEAQLEEFLHTLARRVPVVAVGDSAPSDYLLRHAEYQGRPDPHLWMAPRLWRYVVEGIRDALHAQRPEAAFTAQAAAYLAQVQAVDDYARAVLTTVPESARVLVTAHDAFGYFGRDYGFEVLGVQGISTQSEAGLSRIAELVDTLVQRQIRAVFVESSVSDRNLRALIEGAAAQGHTVQIGGELFSDAMGTPGTYEGTYLGMIDHNATTIARALGGTAPETGMAGKLRGGA
ncbi:metal ABC transporter solute-binding protein, Zn/Mn family [Tropicibacter naphthalenivorans]|uniref:Tromp-1 n=1 Tax=Tropicibacter naphthalenivorans TaxID=441103 RepID=A0A0P1GAS3_9RHOB|nr:zinc ABC transporter substrate-binding protein [Tropicibacter naphthalenivorans]CUH78508.1 Tromp-1 [Tropicibacter naphthalenivorans]SMC80815.1 manganese/zinc/iron transport system substrate-binding protein [Tropicibacter naphthalenivorans]